MLQCGVCTRATVTAMNLFAVVCDADKQLVYLLILLVKISEFLQLVHRYFTRLTHSSALLMKRAPVSVPQMEGVVSVVARAVGAEGTNYK